MTETLQVSGQSIERTMRDAENKQREQAQRIIRKVRPFDASSKNLVCTEARLGVEGIFLREAWQSPDMGDPHLHDKSMELIATSFENDASTGAVQEVTTVLATFHKLCPFDADGETPGYRAVTLSEGVTLEESGQMLAMLETIQVLPVARNLGEKALQSA